LNNAVPIEPTGFKPSDAGAVAARQGNRYQDHIAAQCVLDMLNDPEIVQVECETSDDITLQWQYSDIQYPEYIQVKTTDSVDSKWSKKELCERAIKEKATSIAEKSLLCDCNGVGAHFRFVTRRAVKKNLSILTVPIEQRKGDERIDALAASFRKEHSTKSKNENGLDYWIRNLFWEVAGEVDSVESRNIRRIAKLAEQDGANPTLTHMEIIYKDLLNLVESAALASKTAVASNKVITRQKAREWWQKHLTETDAAVRRTSKVYKASIQAFFAELHQITDEDLLRALYSYDACYDLGKWRFEKLADHLVDWIPEVALQASELANVEHLNLRHKLRDAIRAIEHRGDMNNEQLMAEVLLHALIRQEFGSDPIACKLFYKTKTGIRSFGSAHIVHFESHDELWLGHAQVATAESYDQIIASVMSELENCLEPEFLSNERELLLTLREPQHLRPTSRTLERALQRNTPLDELLSILCIPVLFAYDSNVLSAGYTSDYQVKLVDEVIAQYKALKLQLPQSVQAIKVHIFLVPVESTQTLADLFSKKLRV
jgi:hypothetical protein